MLPLTDNLAIATLTPDANTLRRGIEIFEASPISWNEKGDAAKSVASKLCKACQINESGKPCYICLYRVTADGDLWVELLVALDGRQDIKPSVAEQGIVTLARQLGAKNVRCLVKSPAVARLYTRHGFHAYGVAMVREVSDTQN